MAASLDQKLISKSAAEALIAAHDGDLALLYLYLRSRGTADPERAARDRRGP